MSDSIHKYFVWWQRIALKTENILRPVLTHPKPIEWSKPFDPKLTTDSAQAVPILCHNSVYCMAKVSLEV